jgi:hypothetical protein
MISVSTHVDSKQAGDTVMERDERPISDEAVNALNLCYIHAANKDRLRCSFLQTQKQLARTRDSARRATGIRCLRRTMQEPEDTARRAKGIKCRPRRKIAGTKDTARRATG